MPIKRLPLTGAYNTRPGAVALSGSSGVVGVAIVGVAVVGATSSTGVSKDHRLLNCLQITQADENAQSKRLYVVKRPGFGANSTPENGSIGNAILVWTGQGTGLKVMSCFGGTNSTLYDGTTSKGAITGKARSIVQTDVSGTATLLIASADSTGWYYQDGGTATKITDVDFPGNASRTTVGDFAAMDGYAFIMDSAGRVYNSDINSVVNWTASSYFAANSIPDVGIGVVRHRDTLIAFCKEHLEVLYNAGNPTGTPLSRVNDRTQKLGCVSADAIAQTRDAIYFVGTTKSSNMALYSYNGGQIEVLSTPEIDVRLALAGPSNITVTTLGFFGRQFVVVCAGTATYVYCIEEKNWHEWTGTQFWHKADGVSTGSSLVNYAISRTSTSGKVFVLNPLALTYQDNGSAITATIQTTKVDFGIKKNKTWLCTTIIGDQEMSTSNLSVSWQDDDYQSQSTARTVDLANDVPCLRRCGRSTRRSFLLTHSADTPMRLEAIELEFEVGEI